MEHKKAVSGKVYLPLSKSISNRLLIIKALMEEVCPIEQLSNSDDTCIMFQALSAQKKQIDVGHAGTAMRFLTAYLAQKEGDWVIIGSERMQQRPIGGLVDALRCLGAEIEYMGKKGFPPLRIKGKSLLGGEIEISASVSSQYVSALMLIAPYLKKGLVIHLQGKVVSDAYINMTLLMMQIFGVEVVRHGNRIHIAPQPYQSVTFQVEADWSAASYFYELLAVVRNGELHLMGLKSDSLQGDKKQLELWNKLGVASQFTEEGLLLISKPIEITSLEYDFVEMPDMIPSFVVACCLLNIPFKFRGIETLRIKESDRVAAMKDELSKIGYFLQADNNDCLSWTGEKGMPEMNPRLQTYQDHRLAMAFAVAMLKFPDLQVENREVVSKSFPKFWEEWERVIKY